MDRIFYTVQERDENRKVGDILQKNLGFGSHRLAQLKRIEKGICLNGEEVHTDKRVKKGDIVSAMAEDERGYNPAPPENIPLHFVWEDEYLAVLDKQAGLATQGPSEIGNYTVMSALSYLWGNHVSFHPVNRLDKGTSGLMLLAKSGFIHDSMRKQLHTDSFVRKYKAIISGTLTEEEGIIDKPLARKEGHSLMRIVLPEGKPSQTKYRVLLKEKYTLVEAVPLTGRTHQIRVHFASLGHPLIGDWMYGVEDKEIISRPALHSYFLQFVHPVTGKTMCFESMLPEDMERLL